LIDNARMPLIIDCDFNQTDKLIRMISNNLLAFLNLIILRKFSYAIYAKFSYVIYSSKLIFKVIMYN